MTLRSTIPDLTIPDLDFSTFVLARGRQTPEKPAIIDVATGVQITYGQLIAAIEAEADRLLALGLRPGDLVAICGFNTPSFGVAAHAVWRAGATVVTMNPLFTVREMHQELADAGARYLIAAAAVMERAQEAAGLAGVEHVFTLGEPGSLAAFEEQKQTLPLSTPGGRGPGGGGLHERDDALVLYSSGTTGLPKGVMLTHRNLMAALF
ncbi:MAG: AMP-binding protein, partial [Chloroflexota bacterium]